MRLSLKNARFLLLRQHFVFIHKFIIYLLLKKSRTFKIFSKANFSFGLKFRKCILCIQVNPLLYQYSAVASITPE